MPLEEDISSEDVVDYFKQNGAFPFQRLAVYLLVKPLKLSDAPVVTWKGKGYDDTDVVRVGQIDPTNGEPYEGGFFRHQEEDHIYEMLSSSGDHLAGFQRYFEETYTLTSPVDNGHFH